MKKVNFDDIPGMIAREGVIRKVFSGQNSMLVLNEIKPFAQPALHQHPHEQITYILAGQCDFIMGEETIRMGPGDAILIPPDTRHTLRPVGEETVMNLDVFSPIREDYLV
jgi:quercetin dioxygenase-like cupin family protein